MTGFLFASSVPALFDPEPEVVVAIVVLVWADAALPVLLAVLLFLDDLLNLGLNGGLSRLEFDGRFCVALALLVGLGGVRSVGGVCLGGGVCLLGLTAFDDLADAIS